MRRPTTAARAAMSSRTGRRAARPPPTRSSTACRRASPAGSLVERRLEVVRDGRSGSALGPGLVQGHGLTNESLEGLLVDLLALVEVDGAPDVPLEAGVEEARGVLE